MGASSSGLLDEAKISHIKGLVDSAFQSFSVFYRQQYSAAYCGHLHLEVESKKEGRGLLLTQRPQYDPEDVLYKGTVKFSCWDEQGKKCKERYTVLRRDYKLEIHDSIETFNRGGAAKLVLQPAGGVVLTTEEESKTLLEKTCTGILNGVKEDSSSVVSSDVFAVYLHLPFTGHTCFLFQQEEERDHFLSALKTCIRHHNIDPWCDASYESQAYIRALVLYRRGKSCYESWEMLLGTEEQVLATQVMEEVLPWLQSQLQSRVKGKKPERIRQWLATVQATYALVLEELTVGLEVLRGECRQTASGNQAQIRSNLDQIMSSHCFLEDKVRASLCDEAEKICNESITPYMSSILEALTENISTAIQAMKHTLQKQMDAALKDKNGGTAETKVLSTLCSINLDQCYKQVENLSERLKDLKQRFGLINTQRLIHSVHLEMEKLLDSAVYTLELFLQSSARLQPSQVPVKMERAKERVLKQLDYDSRIVQRRLYHEALLEITLPALTRRMDKKWKTKLQQFEQYIFSDYSSFILIHNVYDDVLRKILSKEIETAVQDAASKKNNNLFLDTSDLAISQYSLLGQTPPCSAPDSPATHARDPPCVVPAQDTESAPTVEEENQKVQCDPESNADAIADPGASQTPMLLSPVIVVTHETDESVTKEDSHIEKSCEDVDPGATTPPVLDSSAAGPSSSDTDPPKTEEPSESTDSTIHLVSSESTPLTIDVLGHTPQSDPPSAPLDHIPSDQVPEESPSAPPSTDSTVQISLVSLSEAIVSNSVASVERNTMVQQSTDRAVYLTGDIRDNWEMDRVKEENQKEEAEEEEVREKQESEGQEKEKVKDEEESEGQEKEKVKDEEESEGQEKEKVKDEEESEGQEKEKVKDEEESEGQEKEKVMKEREQQEKETVTDKEVKREEKEKEKIKDKDVSDSQGTEKVTEKEGLEGLEKEKVKDEEEVEGQHRIEVTDNEERNEQETENVSEKEQREEEKMTKEASGESSYSSCESPAEDATVLTPAQIIREEIYKKTEENEEAERQDETEEDANKNEEEAAHQPIKSQPEGGAELPLDSVAAIRGLVTEVFEVETIVSPYPDSSFVP